ncbi:MAG TPA: hypothetical protein VG890_01295 [Puia sp.]|nr:hypothetical protein [Puia sp.]
MKKNRNGIILVAEIIAVILFHSFKLREPNVKLPADQAVQTAVRLDHIPGISSLLKTKPEYFFLNVLK